MNLETLIYAALGGILPALVWLFFWLREDRKSPEPDGLILKTFLLGMLAVVFVLPFQKGVEIIFPGTPAVAILLWAVFEEVFKLGAGYLGGLKSREDNEPVDPIIYMITAALGFVALENTLFILGPLLGDDIVRTVITGNMRFVGASILHVIASGFIGVSLAFSFYKSRARKVHAGLWGLIVAVAIHTVFNILIINWGDPGAVLAFVGVWIGAAALLLSFEIAKTIAPSKNTGYNE
jgi:RsiW-degrading membrane proteinase PrsW (M82 family)